MTSYCVSTLVQCGLEIPLQAEIYILPTVKNGQLINRYQNYVDLLYYEREISNTVASFIVREEITSS